MGHRSTDEVMIDPRKGDVEDDVSSSKRHSLVSLGGSLLSEISLPRFFMASILLVVLPGVLIGMAPLLASIWVGVVLSKVSASFTEWLPVFFLGALAVLGWVGGRPLLRFAESGFWSLNAVAVQPGYVLCRESFRHLAEVLLPTDLSQDRRATTRAAGAALSGLALCGLALWVVVVAWPHSRWVGTSSDLTSPHLLVGPALANAVVLVAGYLAGAALVWGTADALMAQPRDLPSFPPLSPGSRTWRVAHLSDLHAVGERYGFRIESGRMGARGNDRIVQTLAQLDRIHAEKPLDLIIITGDMTDAGRSAEWAEFFDALAPHQGLSKLLVALPGNHDLNVIDRANPARLDLPTSPKKRLRQIRTISALNALHGSRMRIVDKEKGVLGATLSSVLESHLEDITAFADRASLRLSRSLGDLWASIFPMVLPPDPEDGLGVIILNSNAETHFSFTNALGLVSAEQVYAIEIVTRQYPRACWIVALHHHVVEYPDRAKALSERIGTALVNGSWFVRRLQSLAGRAVVMHGHRHVDWIGDCGGLLIVSAPSQVMEARDEDDTFFYVHSLAIDSGGHLRLMIPERITVPGQPVAT
ncbi:metallophosphoesterase [Nordella sp. HKS 07]|nr:metallophosphoesterase [Nordella sp. HKS 07]